MNLSWPAETGDNERQEEHDDSAARGINQLSLIQEPWQVKNANAVFLGMSSAAYGSGVGWGSREDWYEARVNPYTDEPLIVSSKSRKRLSEVGFLLNSRRVPACWYVFSPLLLHRRSRPFLCRQHQYHTMMATIYQNAARRGVCWVILITHESRVCPYVS